MVEGLLAFSKLCTHVGCPVGLYLADTHLLLCPCHQSTFDVLDGARPSFGPATRSLPQLPLAVDSQVVVVRVEEGQLRPRPGRENWSPQGYVAYSKICPHVGCPVGVYQEATHELLCPCHQSTFDVLDGARPRFGPATRSLPQLPLAVDPEGFLVAQSDFHEPVGPAFWNRG